LPVVQEEVHQERQQGEHSVGLDRLLSVELEGHDCEEDHHAQVDVESHAHAHQKLHADQGTRLFVPRTSDLFQVMILPSIALDRSYARHHIRDQLQPFVCIFSLGSLQFLYASACEELHNEQYGQKGQRNQPIFYLVEITDKTDTEQRNNRCHNHLRQHAQLPFDDEEVRRNNSH
jgi:hypothetical protein